jgi:pimeloyl-ACP methyl ester carboxylesterase
MVPAPISWRSIAGSLAEHHHVIAPDTIGDLGMSPFDASRPRPRNPRDYACWLRDVFDQAIGNDQPGDLVGASFGALIALNFALRARNRVRRMVLLVPPLYSWTGLIRMGGRVVWALSRARSDPDAVERWLFGDSPSRVELGKWLALSKGHRPHLGFNPPIPLSQLRHLDVPTLVLIGGRDSMLGPAGPIEKRARALPAAQVEVLPEAGHLMPLDSPELVASRILAWLAPNFVSE